MPVFNVSFLNPKTRAKTGGVKVGILSDQLTILEQELGKDGYLSPGDYDLLLEKAREIQMTPGLSASQISDYDVKIARYEKAKAVANIDKSEDLEKINRILKGEAAEDVMMVGNNPAEFIRGRVSSYQAKLNDLQEIIQRRAIAGQDIIEYNNEYAAALAEYQERFNALSAMEGWDGKNPILGFVAYITTNDLGEIVDVDYDRHGSRQGYAETNGMIDGFQIYGRINFKRDGKNYFTLGNNIFQAPDMMIPDPTNPGSFRPNKLVADVERTGPITRGKAGYLNIPGDSVRIQSYIPHDSWAKGINGTVYKRRNDGGYTRYMNIDQPLPDMPPMENMITLPDQFERGLMRNVDETIDVSAPIYPDTGMSMAPLEQGVGGYPGLTDPYQQGTPQQPMAPAQPDQSAAPTRRTPQQPRAQASEGAGATIKRTMSSGVDFFKNLFR